LSFGSFSLQYTHPFLESGSGKHYHGSGIRAIDSPPRKTPGWSVFRRKFEFFHFRFNIPTPSLNQGQGSIFKGNRFLLYKNLRTVPVCVVDYTSQLSKPFSISHFKTSGVVARKSLLFSVFQLALSLEACPATA
jgi:hypothetical protein